MKHFYEKIMLSSFFVLGINLAIQAQTKTENYVLTSELTEPTTNATPENVSSKDRIDKITYFDGLGREKLSIISPKADISTFGFGDIGILFLNPSLATRVTYDGFGRVDKEYLPGVVRDLSYTEGVTYTDYPEAQVYSQKQYENSPLNRVEKQGAPGAVWDVSTNRAIKFAYQTNNNDNVLMFGVDASNTLNSVSNYPNYSLYKTTTTDENGQPIIEFKDKEGRIFLKRIQANGKVFNTYYVYDIYGNLACVLPPLLMELTNNSTVIATYTSSLLSELAYQYRYDNKNRLIEKKLPGKNWEYMVYDKLDRLSATKDGINDWIITKYDKFNRVVYTALLGNKTLTRTALQTKYDSATSWNESKTGNFSNGGLTTKYTNAAYPVLISSSVLLTVNYYDNYTEIGASNVAINNQTVVQENDLNSLKGLTVANFVAVLGNGSWEKNYTYYDPKYLRPIANEKINYLDGYTKTASILDFRGKALETLTKHKRNSNSQEIQIKEVFSYDKFERLTKHTHQINNGKVEVLTQNNYNNIGQLTSKKVGNTTTSPYQTVDYKYNIRGWLTQINDITNLGTDLFAFKINYNTKDQTKASHLTQALFNGNISQTLWKSQDNTFLRSYDYNYDGLNRLTGASYSNISKDFAGAYDEILTYDTNGNIKTLKRYGQTEQATPRLIDNLVYNYENSEKSNKLQKVTDSSTTLGFNDANKTGNDYAYDLNGNLIKDLNKGITDSIKYNHLNLPILVKKGTGSIEYNYDATGVKLRKIVKEQVGVNAGLTTTITEYLDGFQYKDGVLQFFPTTEGYVNALTNGTAGYNYVYNMTDHLGNVRVSYAWDDVNNKLKTVNEDHYYPFGLQHKGYNKPRKDIIIGEIGQVEIGVGIGSSGSANYKYKYQGQERQEELGLNWDSFKWRNYMPEIGRFFNIDPLAEKYSYQSPYNFQENKMGLGRELEGLEIALPPWIGIYGGTSFGTSVSSATASLGSTMSATSAGLTSASGTVGVSISTTAIPLDQTIQLEETTISSSSKGGIWERIVDGVTSIGKSIGRVFNNDSNTAPEATNGEASQYENSTNKSKNGGRPTTKNRDTDVSKQEFEKNLENSGFEKSTSKDGKVSTFNKDGKSYSTRDNSSGGKPTAEFRKNADAKKPDLKIRLGE